jgi:hypothetical protein
MEMGYFHSSRRRIAQGSIEVRLDCRATLARDRSCDDRAILRGGSG